MGPQESERNVSLSPVKAEDALYAFNPNQNTYLRRMGFSPELPALMRELNEALSPDYEEPSSVGFTLSPHKTAPTLNMETRYRFGPLVDYYIEGNTFRIQLGRVPLDYVTGGGKISRRVRESNNIISPGLVEADFLHGGPSLVLATLDDLQTFVSETTSNRRATLSATGSYEDRRMVRKKIGTI